MHHEGSDEPRFDWYSCFDYSGNHDAQLLAYQPNNSLRKNL